MYKASKTTNILVRTLLDNLKDHGSIYSNVRMFLIVSQEYIASLAIKFYHI